VHLETEEKATMRAATASVAAVLMLWSISAAALPNPALLLPGCGRCGDWAEIGALEERISRAPSLDEAKELALAPIEQAHRALSRARWLAPYSSSIRTAQRRLLAYQAGVGRARSEAEVAQEFGQLVRLADSGGIPAQAHVLSSCHYTTWEIVAIVIGFILGILPGIILLIILC
jgi:hypothetical protein